VEPNTFDPCIRQYVSTNVSSRHSGELQGIDYLGGDIWQHDGVEEDVAVDDVGPVDDQTVDELQLGQLLHLGRGRQRLAVEVVVVAVVREQRHNLPVTWLGLPRWD